MSDELGESVPTSKLIDPAKADELADKLIERRERLAYFLITGSTAIIAFTVTQLNRSNGPLRTASIPWLTVGWLGLLLSAGSSLMLIWRRHQAYALYLDSLYGVQTEDKERTKAQDRVNRWQMAGLAFFFLGSLVEVATWSVALWSG
jgi:hypothetical protein